MGVLAGSRVGDVNGDGYGDFLVASLAGRDHLYLGSATPRDDDWNGLASPRRIDLIGTGGQGIGGQVAGVGDINGDGFADFVINGRSSQIDAQTGAVWLYLGSATPSLADWNASNSPRRIEMEGPDEQSGFNQYGGTIASAGDVNGDGYGDFIVGDWESNAAYVYLGSATVNAPAWNGTAPPMRLDLTMPDGTFSSFGVAVASAGDVNGDGYGDFLIVAAGAGNGATVHLYLGSAAALASGWNGSSPARRIDLASPGGSTSFFGISAVSAGDINGDGYGDFLISADFGFDHTVPGAAYLFLGSAMLGGAGWTGASSNLRRDLLGPDGCGGDFGKSVCGG